MMTSKPAWQFLRPLHRPIVLATIVRISRGVALQLRPRSYNRSPVGPEHSRLEHGFPWSIMVNSNSEDPARLGNDLNAAMMQAIGSGVAGSPADLYPEFPSPALPPRTK